MGGNQKKTAACKNLLRELAKDICFVVVRMQFGGEISASSEEHVICTGALHTAAVGHHDNTRKGNSRGTTEFKKIVAYAKGDTEI